MSVVIACADGDEIGLSLVDDAADIYFTDIVTVNISTVLMDALPISEMSVPGELISHFTHHILLTDFIRSDTMACWQPSIALKRS